MDKLEAVAEAFAVGEQAHKRIGVTPAMRELMQTYRDNQIAVAETLSEVEPAIEAARAAGIREGLEMAAKACEAERLSEPQDENDAAYDRAIDDCVEAIRALERGDHLKEG